MNGKGNEHTRLCVIESMFIDFQRHMKEHVAKEEKEINMLKQSVVDGTKEIVNHIDTLRQNNTRALADNKLQLIELLDREYVSEAKIDKKMTSMRKSITEEIIKNITESRNRVLRDASILFFGMSVAAIVCAWAYVNLKVVAG